MIDESLRSRLEALNRAPIAAQTTSAQATSALSLEPCVLAGAALFLVGLFRPIEGHPPIDPLLARSYSAAPAALATLWPTIAAHHVLPTLTGESFDWPMVIERSVRHRLQ